MSESPCRAGSGAPRLVTGGWIEIKIPYGLGSRVVGGGGESLLALSPSLAKWGLSNTARAPIKKKNKNPFLEVGQNTNIRTGSHAGEGHTASSYAKTRDAG